MNKIASAAAFLLGLGTLHAVAAEWQPSFEEAFQAVVVKHCQKTEYPDVTRFYCETEPANYYFTKPNTPAHPGVLKRYFSVENGQTILETDAHSWGDDASQDAFVAWMRRLGSDPKLVR